MLSTRRLVPLVAGVALLMCSIHGALPAFAQGSWNSEAELVAAIKEQQQQTILNLFARGANPNGRDNSGRPLWEAANTSALMVDLLLSRKADPNLLYGEKDYKTPPIFNAITREDAESARLLLDHGMDADVRSSNGTTALIYASNRGQLEILKLLLEHQADVHALGADKSPPIALAAASNQPESIELLLEHGAKIDDMASNGQSPLGIAAEKGHVEAAKVLMQHGADIEHIDTRGKTPLDLATDAKHTDIVALLEGGPIAAAPEIPKSTLLGVVAVLGIALFAIVIVRASAISRPEKLDGPEPSSTRGRWSDDGFAANAAGGRGPGLAAPMQTAQVGAQDKTVALWEAVERRQAGAIAQLLRNGADPFAAGPEGASAIVQAVGTGDATLMDVFMRGGVNPNDPRLDPPLLFMAAELNEPSVVRSLLAGGAYAESAYDGTPALYKAVERGYQKVVDVLLDKGASPDGRQQEGNCWTPLMAAAAKGNQPAIRALLNAGADRAICSPRGLTAAQIGEQSGHPELVALIEGFVRTE